jgi:hypothetical protein
MNINGVNEVGYLNMSLDSGYLEIDYSDEMRLNHIRECEYRSGGSRLATE